MTTFSSTIDANSFQANDLLEKGERRSVGRLGYQRTGHPALAI